MIRIILGALTAIVAAALLLSFDADARRRRERPVRVDPVAGIVDIGPKVVRTVKVDPCEAPYTFGDLWRCRAP